MNKPLTIKSLLAFSLAMLISLFSLQSFADEAEQFNSPDSEIVEIDSDFLIPDEEMLDDETGLEIIDDEEAEEIDPLSQSDDVNNDSDNEEDKDQPESSQLMFG